MTPIQRLLEPSADMIAIPFHTRSVCPLCGKVAVRIDEDVMLAPVYLLDDLPPGSVIQ